MPCKTVSWKMRYSLNSELRNSLELLRLKYFVACQARISFASGKPLHRLILDSNQKQDILSDGNRIWNIDIKLLTHQSSLVGRSGARCHFPIPTSTLPSVTQTSRLLVALSTLEREAILILIKMLLPLFISLRRMRLIFRSPLVYNSPLLGKNSLSWFYRNRDSIWDHKVLGFRRKLREQFADCIEVSELALVCENRSRTLYLPSACMRLLEHERRST